MEANKKRKTRVTGGNNNHKNQYEGEMRRHIGLMVQVDLLRKTTSRAKKFLSTRKEKNSFNPKKKNLSEKVSFTINEQESIRVTHLLKLIIRTFSFSLLLLFFLFRL